MMKSNSDTVRYADCLLFEAPGRVRLAMRSVPFPGLGQIRIRIIACGVCHHELHVLAGRLPRRFPDVLGHEPVGIVDAIGQGVTGFHEGQWVTGVGSASLAEYDLAEARYIAPIAEPVRPEHWLGEPAMCAVNAVNRLPNLSGRTVMVCGSGFMGNLLVQALRLKTEPLRLIAVDTDAGRLVLAVDAGADETFVFDSEPLRRMERSVDVVIEASGAPGMISVCSQLVRNGGILVLFAHHFQVDPSIVNEWHLRGLTILNTVPWAAPDLSHEVYEAVEHLQAGRLRMDCLVGRTVFLRKAPDTLREMAVGIGARCKTVVLMTERDKRWPTRS